LGPGARGAPRQPELRDVVGAASPAAPQPAPPRAAPRYPHLPGHLFAEHLAGLPPPCPHGIRSVGHPLDGDNAGQGLGRAVEVRQDLPDPVGGRLDDLADDDLAHGAHRASLRHTETSQTRTPRSAGAPDAREEGSPAQPPDVPDARYRARLARPNGVGWLDAATGPVSGPADAVVRSRPSGAPET